MIDGAVDGVKRVSVKCVVGDVGDEKERREDKGGHHAGAVSGDAAVLNEVEADQQGDGA